MIDYLLLLEMKLEKKNSFNLPVYSDNQIHVQIRIQ